MTHEEQEARHLAIGATVIASDPAGWAARWIVFSIGAELRGATQAPAKAKRR